MAATAALAAILAWATLPAVAAAQGAARPGFLRAPEPNPKRGGTLRVAGPHTVPHFDVYQGAWPLTMALAYNGLVRKNPLDGLQTIIPDLAERWEVSADGKTYTFFLRGGVKFHDGSPFSSADVVATFTKILKPPAGVISVYRDNLAMIDRVEAVNPLTVRIVLSNPAAYFLELLTGGTNLFFSLPMFPKKVLEDNNYDLRKLSAPPPGTGPFRFKEHKAAERWVYERNPDYWNPELPYIDRLELLHVPQMTDRGSAVLTGQADLTMNASVDVWREAEKRKDQMGVARTPSLASHTVHVNNERKPFTDTRVRRALFLAVSRQNIHQAYQDQEPIAQGRWMASASPFSPPMAEILKLPGYRADKTADVAEAKKLLAEAGVPSGFGPIELVSATAPWAADIMAPAFAEEIKSKLNITSKIRLVERGLLPEQYKNGTFDVLVETQFSGAIADPTPMWNAYLKCKASQNYSRYCNPDFDKLLETIGKETDDARRRQLMSRAMDLLDQTAPFIVTGFTQHSTVWRSHVKGLAIDKRIHSDWGRYDTVWLDK
jgi:ABC-type transport system substrate-binding protein